MNIETVLERRNDMLVTFRVLQNIRNPFSVAVIQEREDLERDLKAYRVARAAFLEHRRFQRTAAALAEAQAENARLRAALEAIAKSAETAIARATATPQNQHLYSRACGWDAAATIARAALETAPAGEA